MTRQRFGEYLNHCFLGGIVVFCILWATDFIPATKRVSVLFFAFSLLLLAIISMLTDEVGLKGGGIVKKSENPTGFWGMVIFYLITSSVMFVASFFV